MDAAALTIACPWSAEAALTGAAANITMISTARQTEFPRGDAFEQAAADRATGGMRSMPDKAVLSGTDTDADMSPTGSAPTGGDGL